MICYKNTNDNEYKDCLFSNTSKVTAARTHFEFQYSSSSSRLIRGLVVYYAIILQAKAWSMRPNLFRWLDYYQGLKVHHCKKGKALTSILNWYKPIIAFFLMGWGTMHTNFRVIILAVEWLKSFINTLYDPKKFSLSIEISGKTFTICLQNRSINAHRYET